MTIAEPRFSHSALHLLPAWPINTGPPSSKLTQTANPHNKATNANRPVAFLSTMTKSRSQKSEDRRPSDLQPSSGPFPTELRCPVNSAVGSGRPASLTSDFCLPTSGAEPLSFRRLWWSRTPCFRRLWWSRTPCFRRLWWSRPGSNRRPPACKAGALPAELRPRDQMSEARTAEVEDRVASSRVTDFRLLSSDFCLFRAWWAREDLNFRPHAYQARALTN
jgi:hypothetical protein